MLGHIKLKKMADTFWHLMPDFLFFKETEIEYEMVLSYSDRRMTADFAFLQHIKSNVFV